MNNSLIENYSFIILIMKSIAINSHSQMIKWLDPTDPLIVNYKGIFEATIASRIHKGLGHPWLTVDYADVGLVGLVDFPHDHPQQDTQWCVVSSHLYTCNFCRNLDIRAGDNQPLDDYCWQHLGYRQLQASTSNKSPPRQYPTNVFEKNGKSIQQFLIFVWTDFIYYIPKIEPTF